MNSSEAAKFRKVVTSVWEFQLFLTLEALRTVSLFNFKHPK